MTIENAVERLIFIITVNTIVILLAMTMIGTIILINISSLKK